MPKDYHKGVKLQCYITEDLSQRLDKYIQNVNNYLQEYEDEKITKTTVIKTAILEFLANHDINS